MKNLMALFRNATTSALNYRRNAWQQMLLKLNILAACYHTAVTLSLGRRHTQGRKHEDDRVGNRRQRQEYSASSRSCLL